MRQRRTIVSSVAGLRSLWRYVYLRLGVKRVIQSENTSFAVCLLATCQRNKKPELVAHGAGGSVPRKISLSNKALCVPGGPTRCVKVKQAFIWRAEKIGYLRHTPEAVVGIFLKFHFTSNIELFVDCSYVIDDEFQVTCFFFRVCEKKNTWR